MKVSVIMIDGGFREHTFGAEYFSRQDFPDDEYEVIWVEFYSSVPDHVKQQKKVQVVTLDNPPGTKYHSSYCFNKGIEMARGEVIVIPDADQLVRRDFLQRIYDLHAAYDRLVVYPYRYDEPGKGVLTSFDFEEVEKKCVLKNPLNYGGCLTVRKKWLVDINGYEQHSIFSSGFHANGLDIYTRFKNYGLAIMWTPDIRLYHPWHPFTLASADEYTIQKELIDWRARRLQYLAIDGISPSRNAKEFDEQAFMDEVRKKQAPAVPPQPAKKAGLIQRILKKIG